jgi:hypothetical protein
MEADFAHFSLLASCKRSHDPWVYFRDVPARLPAPFPKASEE